MRKLAFVHLFAVLALLCTTSCDDETNNAPGIWISELGTATEIVLAPGEGITFTCYLSDEESIQSVTAYCDAWIDWDWYDYWDLSFMKDTNPAAVYEVTFTVPDVLDADFETQVLTFDVEDISGLHTIKNVNIVSSATN